MSKTIVCCAVASLLSVILPACGQDTSACGRSPVVAADALPNLFNVEQERWLGEAVRDEMESSTDMVSDGSLNEHLQAIVDRLAKNLPEPHVPFHVVLYESSEVNGYSIAGGSIYISRKLASVAQNDDELAAVLGHEMGHIASHQFAFEMTKEFQRLLHVSSLGGQKDVYEKYQQLYDAEMADKHPSSHDDDEGQDEADRVGVYLVAAAGFRPQAFAEFWNRTQFVQGKTGSRLTDLFGMTKPDQKRLRGMQAMIAALPAHCGGPGSTQPELHAFEVWQRRVIANQKVAVTERGASVVKLEDPLQMELDQVRFSLDGKELLAQDASSIYVVDRESLKVRTRIDADRAQAANFTPDGKGITFTTPGLHTERWTLDGKLVEAHEPLAQHPCVQTKLSPDGRTIVCLNLDETSWEMGVSLLDSTSGDVLWQKKNFFEPNQGLIQALMAAQTNFDLGEVILSSTSSDGNFLLIGPGEQKLAFDLRSRTPVQLSGALKDDVTGSYAFLGSDRVAGVNLFDPGSSGLFSFPDGRKVKPLRFEIPNLESVTGPGNRLMVRSGSLMGQAMNVDDTKKKDATTIARYDDRQALVDLEAGKFLMGTRSSALDYWNDLVATQASTGEVGLTRLDGKDAKDQRMVQLPTSPLSALYSVAMSPDGRFLAYSTRDRSALWDVANGKRLMLMRSFRSVRWTDPTTMIADFKKSDKGDRQLVRIDLKAMSSTLALGTLIQDPKDFERMENGYLTEWKQGKGKGWTLMLHSFADGGVLWTKTFTDGYPLWTITAGGSNLIFTYAMQTDAAKKACKEDRALAAEAASLKKKEIGGLVEVVDPKTGTTISRTVLEVPADYTGTNGLNMVDDLLLVTGGDNRTLAYSASTGKREWQAFAWVMAVDAASGRVAVWNRSNEAIVFNKDGHELLHTQVGDTIRYAAFEGGGGTLKVLTSDQSLHVLSVAEAGKEVAEVR